MDPQTMTNEWTESATNEVLYPDDLEGYGPLEVVSQPMPADDVPNENARYGKFGKLGDANDAEWFAAPRQLRAAIGAVFTKQDGLPVCFEVLDAEKGPQDDSEWSFEIRSIESGDML